MRLTLEHDHPRMCRFRDMQLYTAKVLFHDATDYDLQYQTPSYLDKHDNHVATAVGVKENIITRYAVWSSKTATSVCNKK